MRRQVRTVAIGFALALLGATIAVMPGCTRSYPYELRGVVRSAADGSPLAGVTVDVEPGLLDQTGLPATTAADGSFIASFRASDGEFMTDRLPSWSATLSRDEYVTEVIDISPRREPESRGPPTQILIVVYLRPKTP
jgi:hypothetical protein